jgi:tRNA 2-selenouridine synthase
LIHKIDIIQFIEQAQCIPIIDVRSEGEFAHAHIPGALNLTLLNNEERAIVGTTYKQEGNQAAVLKGYQLVGYKFHEFLQQAIQLAPDKKVGMYCWRGGLRSNIMAFLLHTAGFEVLLLQGGYKKYRHWVLQTLELTKKIRIVGGKTGVGKTYILHEIKKLGGQVIDLEQLACHRGSAFGALGQSLQPSVEMFENKLAVHWNALDSNKVTWLENESRLIGKVRIPHKVYDAMRQAITYDLQLPLQQRIENILKDYGSFDKQILAECTKKVEKKMGNLRMQQALDFLMANELNAWIFMLLEYYDKNYLHSKQQRKSETVFAVSANGKSNEEIAKLLIALAEN